MTGIEADVGESTRTLAENLDDLRTDWETMAMMKLSRQSLSVSEEPDPYTARDVTLKGS